MGNKMVQVINETNAGGRLGAALGTGLSSGLQNLSQLKLNEITSRNQQAAKAQEIARQAQNFLGAGYSPQQAWFLANASPQVGAAFLTQYEPQGGGMQNMQGLAPQQQPQEMQGQGEQEIAPEMQTQIRELLSGLGQGQQFNPIMQALGKPQQKLGLSQQAQQPKASIQQPQTKVQQPQQGIFGESKQKRIERHEQEKTASKETQQYYSTVLSEEKAAKQSDLSTNKMLKLIDKGNLPSSTFYSIFKNLEDHITPATGIGAGAALGAGLGSIVPGIGTAIGATAGGAIGALIQPVATLLRAAQRKIAPDTEEFEKLSAGFISGAKAVFGSRITDSDLKHFMQTVPTLSNTDAGKRAIIKNIQLANKGIELKAKAMKAIIKENGGMRPVDLQIQVEDRVAPQLDKLAKDFING